MIVYSDGLVHPSTPFFLFYNQKPSIGRFRVLGCPAIAKVYYRVELHTRLHLDSKNLVQHGFRAIFFDFPQNQPV